ncbi:two pore domain potassium channel family protein [Virgibacillus halodenitrificans]|uniref:Two pore domain potassium channel family protein n=1 Tax=Virgibacillus halodenitrificans TaxID=1482 RepID=A0AAC9IYB8_VIRHA|nr:potassium channel family protein [Virgibacillus halodenitrificans]APC47265.1 hypothetical protein BME96_03280 [Virgibacillus halodenitrificans]MBD1224766.1 two pore domain potassium channel family protein [Virgibacillus halodenitrificans]MCG1028089.1 two pore domain potassium channel family protein [Virgibacillus halodenitrificans]MCJ0933181.1 potassium channel family protein [Virgibacillus halodenitrificans]MEC2159293.1 potassium channel family protein [Virgibacillus halodenitrificans]
MNTIPVISLILISVIILKSIINFIPIGKYKIELKDSRFSSELFFTLFITYIVVIIGFGLVYFILSLQNTILVENGELREVGKLGSFIHSMYFSGVTILTIGYGDITPIGIGRLIAIAEALIGYILPAAFVLRVVELRGRSRDE